MDILDNIMYAYQNVLLANGNQVDSDFLPRINLGTPAAVPGTTVFNYPVATKFNFCAYPDPVTVERATARHWYDVNDGINYPGLGGVVFSNFQFSSTYHLIFAYLVENTRIIQIFERVVEEYMRDESLGIAENAVVFNWLQNTERLFFKNDSPRVTNIRSLIRPSSDDSRRNAYYRMFGMDLAFGNATSTAPSNYFKAKSSNQQFVPVFEKYIAEIWQGYLNARNQVGPNTTDINVITDLAIQLEELLQARRGAGVNYAERNLSREEFSSVLLTSWFAFAISFDACPLLDFLGCESSTMGERLMKIGDKVGIPAHKKSQALFEMAAPAANILCGLETGGFLNNPAWVTGMLSSLVPGAPPGIQATYMTDFLTVINNWERATGHRIKNPEGNITGTVKVQNSGVKSGQPVMN
jgi:hypothetical protein